LFHPDSRTRQELDWMRNLDAFDDFGQDHGI
jgi:hypothetical protein